MLDILHKIGIQSSLNDTYQALTTLVSPKSLLETGEGAPFPNDIKIDSWE